MLYRTVVADPPWKYGDRLQDGKGAEAHYRQVMETADICKLALHYAYGADLGAEEAAKKHWVGVANLQIMKQEIADDAVLFLWTTEPFLLNGAACQVVRAWGFEPKQLWHWIKGEVRDDAIVGPLGLGRYLRVDTESLVVATRGRASSLVMRHDLRNYTLVAPKGAHSAKPEEMTALIETLVPGPYLELFARRLREGWTTVGDELP